jgi:hypothetical protein
MQHNPWHKGDSMHARMQLTGRLHDRQVMIKRTKGRKPFVVTRGLDKSAAPNFNFNVSHEVGPRPASCAQI